VRVRRARVEELDAVGELTVAAYVADGMDLADSYVEVLADAARRAGDADLLVAVDADDRLLGTVTVCEPGTPWAEVSRPGELEFRMLAVTPAAQGRGVGERLIRAVLDRADERGVYRVVLCSSDYMHVAHRLYHRLGFTRLPCRDWQPVPGLQLLAFALELDR
jgi:GNAT superfamily N-acetyltransferase